MVIVMTVFVLLCLCALRIGYLMDLNYIKQVGAADYKRHWNYYGNIDSYARKVYWTTWRFALAKLLNRLSWTCWTDLAMWAMYANDEALRGALFGAEDCIEESVMNPNCECMCGKYCDGGLASEESATAMAIVVPPNPWEPTGDEFMFQDLLRIAPRWGDTDPKGDEAPLGLKATPPKGETGRVHREKGGGNG